MQKTVETFANACAFTAEAQSALRQTAQRLERYPQSMRVFTACRKALFDGDETLWARLDALAEESGIHRFTVHQLFLIFCAGETAARYQEAGYAPALYWDTMKDLRCKMEETCQVYGVWGVCCGPFLANLLRMRCVCLGRLQFELLRSEFAFSLAGSSLRIGEPVVNVHIPSFGKLSYEAVTDSYRRAAEFFQQKFPDGTVWFHCETWMLDPQVNALLPEGNMKRFTRDYTVVRAFVDPAQDDRYRIFRLPPETPIAEYPADNALQSRLRDWLLAGNTMGVGCGLLLWKDGEVIEPA